MESECFVESFLAARASRWSSVSEVNEVRPSTEPLELRRPSLGTQYRGSGPLARQRGEGQVLMPCLKRFAAYHVLSYAGQKAVITSSWSISCCIKSVKLLHTLVKTCTYAAASRKCMTQLVQPMIGYCAFLLQSAALPA